MALMTTKQGVHWSCERQTCAASCPCPLMPVLHTSAIRGRSTRNTCARPSIRRTRHWSRPSDRREDSALRYAHVDRWRGTFLVLGNAVAWVLIRVVRHGPGFGFRLPCSFVCFRLWPSGIRTTPRPARCRRRRSLPRRVYPCAVDSVVVPSSAGATEAMDSDNKGPYMTAVLWSLTSVAGVFLALRIYCKKRRGTGLWWDDHLMVMAWVSRSSGSGFHRQLTGIPWRLL